MFLLLKTYVFKSHYLQLHLNIFPFNFFSLFEYLFWEETQILQRRENYCQLQKLLWYGFIHKYFTPELQILELQGRKCDTNVEYHICITVWPLHIGSSPSTSLWGCLMLCWLWTKVYLKKGKKVEESLNLDKICLCKLIVNIRCSLNP